MWYDKVMGFLKWLAGLLGLISRPLPMPQDTKKIVAQDLLVDLCLAIQTKEGWFTGSRSWRNRNPGNLKYIGQKGSVGKDDKGFAIFTTYEEGLAALKNMILRAAQGKSIIYKSNMSLYEFFNLYAPSADDNNPRQYAEQVAYKLNVKPDTFRLKDLINNA